MPANGNREYIAKKIAEFGGVVLRRRGKRTGIYRAIETIHKDSGYPIEMLCQTARISRSAYYKHNKRVSSREHSKENISIMQCIAELYTTVRGIYGYRRMTMNINAMLGSHYNNKRILRLMHIMKLSSVIRRKKKKYVPSKPEITTDNILNRKFYSSKQGEKWLTDVTEFKLSNGRKAYLSAILDLWDNSIISYNLGCFNDNSLVLETIDTATESFPGEGILLHSDRGSQYTNKTYNYRLEQAGIRHSMSRVGRCIDNGPMEGFWGIIKSEMYYLNKFQNIKELSPAIDRYIKFYNTERRQQKLNKLPPLGFRNQQAENMQEQ